VGDAVHTASSNRVHWPRVHPGRPVYRDDGLRDEFGANVEWGDDRDVLYQVRRDGRMQLWRVRLGAWENEGDSP
jgi:hypothetical protein